MRTYGVLGILLLTAVPALAAPCPGLRTGTLPRSNDSTAVSVQEVPFQRLDTVSYNSRVRDLILMDGSMLRVPWSHIIFGIDPTFPTQAARIAFVAKTSDPAERNRVESWTLTRARARHGRYRRFPGAPSTPVEIYLQVTFPTQEEYCDYVFQTDNPAVDMN